MAQHPENGTRPGPTGDRPRLRDVSLRLPAQPVGGHDALPLVPPTPRLSLVPPHAAGASTAPVTTTTPTTPAVPEQRAPREAADAPAPAPLLDAAPATAPVVPAAPVPTDAEWTAPHRGRLVAVALLVATALGTLVLGWRFYVSGATADLSAAVVAMAVVVLLWGAAVTATPQAVTLRGSLLTVWTGREQERFDLADAAQLVDLTGRPGSADWALLLHRRDGTARVLRRRDVDAVTLDAVVRHHRDRAAQRAADRERRFNL